MSDPITKTRKAGGDLSNGQYHAVALDDGDFAANGKEAGGILINKPESGEAASLAVIGESRFAAGGAVAAGARLTVSASGWFTACASGYYFVGRNGDAAVTSGSIGKGFFNFATPVYQVSSL